MKKQFENKVSLVTGGAAGIGKAIALAFAKEGAKVVVSDVNADKGEETAKLAKEAGAEAIFIKADVSKKSDVENLISKTVEKFGSLDFAVNNAGVEGNQAPTAESAEDNWDFVINVNLKGTWLCMKSEIQQMLEQKSGVIVNISSIAGVVGFQGLTAYSASKGGVNQLTKAAALEYAQSGIRINAICPGVIRTEMVDRVISKNPDMEKALKAGTPVGRLGKPEEIASAVTWLCTDDAAFVIGHPMIIDGGWVAQ